MYKEVIVDLEHTFSCQNTPIDPNWKQRIAQRMANKDLEEKCKLLNNSVPFMHELSWLDDDELDKKLNGS